MGYRWKALDSGVSETAVYCAVRPAPGRPGRNTGNHLKKNHFPDSFFNKPPTQGGAKCYFGPPIVAQMAPFLCAMPLRIPTQQKVPSLKHPAVFMQLPRVRTAQGPLSPVSAHSQLVHKHRDDPPLPLLTRAFVFFLRPCQSLKHGCFSGAPARYPCCPFCEPRQPRTTGHSKRRLG